MNKTLALAGLFAFSNAAAAPLVIADGPTGEKASLVLSYQTPSRTWDGNSWNPDTNGVLWQEAADSVYCALTGRLDPVTGLSTTLRCRDLLVPGGSWITIAPPTGLSYGIYDSELSLAVTPEGVATIDGLFTDLDPATGEVELQWWNWDSQNRNWVFVLGNIPALEDIALDSRGNSACVVWTVPHSGFVTTACDWNGNRILEIPFTVNQVTAPNAEWVSGLVVTTAGFAAVAWYDDTAQVFETASVLDDGTVTVGPPGHTLVFATNASVAYNDGANGLIAWDPWGLSQRLYTWPAQGWGVVGEHAGNVWVTEQDPATGRWGALTLVY